MTSSFDLETWRRSALVYVSVVEKEQLLSDDLIKWCGIHKSPVVQDGDEMNASLGK